MYKLRSAFTVVSILFLVTREGIKTLSSTKRYRTPPHSTRLLSGKRFLFSEVIPVLVKDGSTE